VARGSFTAMGHAVFQLNVLVMFYDAPYTLNIK